MPNRAHRTSILAVGLTGCIAQTAPKSSDATDLCNGSDDVRLAARSVAGGEWQASDELFYDELGTAFVYVLGTCEYFAFPADVDDGVWATVRTGTLDPEQAAALAADMAFGQLASLEGLYVGGDTRGVISNGTQTIMCTGNCSNPAGALPDALEVIRAWSNLLWDEGTPYDGGMRVFVVEEADYELPDATPWAADVELGGLAYPLTAAGGYAVGTSTLLPASPDTTWLRDQVLATTGPAAIDRSVLFKEGEPGDETAYSVAARDALPFESPEGLVPLPIPCETHCGSYGQTCIAGYCQG